VKSLLFVEKSEWRLYADQNEAVAYRKSQVDMLTPIPLVSHTFYTPERRLYQNLFPQLMTDIFHWELAITVYIE